MRSERTSHSNSPLAEGSLSARVRLMFWAALCSLLVGAIGLGQPVENMLRDMRNVVRQHPASGDLVIVAIDDKSLQQLEKWPWPRQHHAAITNRLHDLGAKEIFFDVDFSSASDPQNDRALAAAFAQSGASVTLPVHLVTDPTSGTQSALLPIEAFKHNVELASITVRNNFRGEVRELFYSARIDRRVYPSFAAKIAGVEGAEGTVFPIDFAIDARTIPVISIADLLTGEVGTEQVAGKTAIVAATTVQLGDKYLVSGYGVLPGVYLHALGAETLKAGPPASIGWLLPLLSGLIIAAAIVFLANVRFAAVCVSALAGMFMFVPIALEDRLIFVDIVPSLIFLLSVSGVLAWASFKQFYRARGSINAISGLPNLNILRQEAAGRDSALVVAKVHNYAEIASALTSEGEETLVRQIAHRLTLISQSSRLYQSDEGIFVWFAGDDLSASAGEYLDSIFEIFRSPMLVLGSQVDTTITFGVDARNGQPLASRLGSAIVASDDALREGLKWKQYDPSQSEDTAWKLSLLSQLDQAIDAGDLWIAFQPKMDVATRRIVGAEALARWHHPEKGAINPIDFILAAEQSGRIGKLTDYVLARSIKAAATVNSQGIAFNVAVNLSAKLIDGMALTSTISRLLAEYKLAPHCLTLEITETAALAGGGRDLDILKDLRKMGIQLSIDDYGTGLSTLDYMKRIPATEIKIDKSFIEAIEKSRSDRLMVHSTIQLAHSLGQKVVAEGVERAETLEMLALMGCDIAQGYLIGRPVPIKELETCLVKQRRAA